MAITVQSVKYHLKKMGINMSNNEIEACVHTYQGKDLTPIEVAKKLAMSISTEKNETKIDNELSLSIQEKSFLIQNEVKKLELGETETTNLITLLVKNYHDKSLLHLEFLNQIQQELTVYLATRNQNFKQQLNDKKFKMYEILNNSNSEINESIKLSNQELNDELNKSNDDLNHFKSSLEEKMNFFRSQFPVLG